MGKRRAVELFDDGSLEAFAPGTYNSLAAIHERLFSDIYDFAGKMRDVDIARSTSR